MIRNSAARRLHRLTTAAHFVALFLAMLPPSMIAANAGRENPYPTWGRDTLYMRS